MSKKVTKKLILVGVLLLCIGCGAISATTIAGTAGSAAAGKVIEHSAGYGIQTPHTIIKKVMPTVVTVTVDLMNTVSDMPRRFVKPSEPIAPQPRQHQFSSGSGFVFHEDGYVVTNWHVIRNAINAKSKIRIGFSNYAQYEATIFNYDETSDLAILKITNEEGEKFKKVKWGAKPKLGGHAIIIGSPIGLEFSISFGIISAVDRTILRAAPPFVPYVQTDAAMNRGNSGGPLFNADGEVIGINTLILSPGSTDETGGNIGLGFSVDGQYAQDILMRLMKGEQIKWSYMGIHYRLLDRNETKSNNLNFGENVIVQKISSSGAAYNKLFIGDIVQKLDGEIVKHTNFASMIARKAPGTIIVLEVLRDGKIVNVEITLMER